MKFVVVFLLFLSTFAFAKTKCISPERAGMPKLVDLSIPSTKYSVGFCYFPEKVTMGIHAQYHKDLIVLKSEGVAIANSKTKMPITVGRIADLMLEKTSDRFIGVSYGAGEFCNGLVVFDAKLKKAAYHNGCASESDECHITELNESKCQAQIECRDKGAEGEAPKRKEPTVKTVKLCQ